jgi:hypothetical protein
MRRRRARERDIDARLDRLEAALHFAPDPETLSDEEWLARLQNLAERIQGRREAISRVEREPGSDKLTDQEFAEWCGFGVTAEMVHNHRHPKTLTEEERQDHQRRHDGIRKRLAEIRDKEAAKLYGELCRMPENEWEDAIRAWEKRWGASWSETQPHYDNWLRSPPGAYAQGVRSADAHPQPSLPAKKTHRLPP